MKLLKALVVATALAIPATAVQVVAIDTPAHAHAKKKKKSAYKTCGTFMYRKGGKCLDARNKK